MRIPRLSLLGKLWLSTSVALTALFAILGWVMQRSAVATTSRSLEEEVTDSFEAYESLWRARAEKLASVSAILSSMPDVRAAFGTGHQATVRDTAREMWNRISDSLNETTLFLVTDPRGVLIVSLGDTDGSPLPQDWPVVRTAALQFPKQVSGFHVTNGQLYQFVLTPVYVDTPRGPALINVLVAGYQVNHLVAARLRDDTGGSEFMFLSPERVFASTLNDRATAVLAASLRTGKLPERLSDGVGEYLPLVKDLMGLEGRPVGQLSILRSFDAVQQHLATLRREVVLMWILTVAVGLAATYWLARRIIEPVLTLDRAAAEVARQNYDFRVEVSSEDELGRLAQTFNSMCASLQSARAELIRQERLATIARLGTSIVHDLRNPLAAIYGGAEMLVDTELLPAQRKRLAGNIYEASRRVSALLQDLVNVSRGKTEAAEVCGLRDVLLAAVEPFRSAAERQGVRISVEGPEEILVPLERARVERVFSNLVANAMEVMPDGGTIWIRARFHDGHTTVEVEDTGPGIAPEILDKLFQPFATGKKNGLGLGLALSRQTVLDHGGDLWADTRAGLGARFLVDFPKATLAPARLPAAAV